jgi:predicted short-subunit dehydrogenase-like oxidoreductase (DUF2520 family)
MIESVNVIGAGRVGSAVIARLAERGVQRSDDPDVCLLCVPDAAISATVQGQSLDRCGWIAHTSGATPLSALDPHDRRFGLHPLVSFSRNRGAEQLDGGFAAITAESDDARAAGFELAELLGLRPFALAEQDRVLYHAAAAIAANYLVTLHRAAADLFEEVDAPVDALQPLIQSVIDNGFELTGPISRGDWSTVGLHLDALRARRPALEPLYRMLAEATAA